jgi:hypothetical protein
MRWRWHVLADLVKWNGLRAGAEIGVAEGRFTANLLSLCPDLVLWAVDHWPAGYKTWMGTEWSAEFQAENRAKFTDVLTAHAPRVTLLEKPSLEAAAWMDDGALDFVFIDADHSYDAVKADIAAWKPKIRDGGWLTGHDFAPVKFPGVVKAVEESFKDFTLGDDCVWMAQI